MKIISGSSGIAPPVTGKTGVAAGEVFMVGVVTSGEELCVGAAAALAVGAVSSADLLSAGVTAAAFFLVAAAAATFGVDRDDRCTCWLFLLRACEPARFATAFRAFCDFDATGRNLVALVRLAIRGEVATGRTAVLIVFASDISLRVGPGCRSLK